MLQAEHIRRGAGDVRLLNDVSLTVSAGERLAIVGPTGSGKTLLVRALALLDPVDAGEIHWRGANIPGSAVPEFRSRVIYLHQRPALIEGTVEDNLRLPFTLHVHRDRACSRDSLLAMLSDVGRDAAFFDTSARDLSGGEAQIVALLRAIQLEPSVLLLDEPTASLDEATTRQIEQLVLNWCKASNAERAVVWVSHDREQTSRIATRVARMSDGVLHCDNSSETPQ